MEIIVVYSKRDGFFGAFKDRLAAGKFCGVHYSTITRWLPFHEDARFIVGICEYRKSNKGTNNFKK